MPRAGDVYSLPPGTQAVSGATADSADINSRFTDLETDANTARPISVGGTGATSVSAAQTAFKIPAYDGTPTVSGNWTVSGAWTFSGNQTWADNAKAIFGTGGDLEIYHNGSNSFIADVGVGALSISGSIVQILGTSSEVLLRATAAGAVDLRHNNSTKAVTTSTGFTVTGLISADTIGGSMVSTDISADTGSTTKVPNVDAVETAIAAAQTTWAVDSDRIISAASTFTWAHGLGAVPKIIQAELVCQTGEFNYTAGQVIQVPIGVDASNRGISIIKDATNLTVRMGSGATIMAYPNATTGAGSALTYANWKLRLRAAI